MDKQEKKITVILPVHMYDEEIDAMIKSALASVELPFVKLIIATTPALENEEFCKVADKVVTNENSEFAALVNKAVDAVDTEFFSIMEFDDVYKLGNERRDGGMRNIAFRSALEFANARPDVSLFIPMEDIAERKGKEAKFIAFANEAPLAEGFTEELGVVSMESLEHFFNYTLTGAVFKTEDFKAVGKLKESIKLTFWLEYMRRAMQNNQKLMVLPKNGYIHFINREGSLFDIYSHTMKEGEVNYWYKIAKTAYKEKADAGYQYTE